MKPGHVYILSNKSMPGIIKIGYTANDPEQRAKELSSTGVAEPFTVTHSWYGFDAYEAEQKLHKHFAHYRVNKHREFFRDDCLADVREFMGDTVEEEDDLPPFNEFMDKTENCVMIDAPNGCYPLNGESLHEYETRKRLEKESCSGINVGGWNDWNQKLFKIAMGCIAFWIVYQIFT